MLRNYGTQDGELYKPDNMEMGGNEQRGGRRENAGRDPGNAESRDADNNKDILLPK